MATMSNQLVINSFSFIYSQITDKTGPVITRGYMQCAEGLSSGLLDQPSVNRPDNSPFHSEQFAAIFI